MVALLLEHWRLLSAPLLYLSLFFKRHRDEYYRRLRAVRSDGDWEGWTGFFLEGIATIANEAVATARELFALLNRDRLRVLETPGSSVMAARLFECLPQQPMITVARAMELLVTTRPTAAKAIAALVDAGVLVESSGRKRDRTFMYAANLDLLRVGTDLFDR
jgi:Fic family protein